MSEESPEVLDPKPDLTLAPLPEKPKPLALQSPDDYLQEFDKEKSAIQKLKTKAKAIYDKRGELCDSEGFYQHSGECWSDAIQQVMNNSDTLKEKVQKKYIDSEFDVNQPLPDTIFKIRHDSRSFIQNGKIDLSINVSKNLPEYNLYGRRNQETQKDLRKTQKKWILLYLKEAQKRFLRHYVLEGERRNYKEKACKTQEPAILAKYHIKELSKQLSYRGQGKEGRLTAIFGMLEHLSNPKTRVSLEEYIEKSDELSGGTDQDIETLINVYNIIFFDNKLEYSYLNLNRLGEAFRFIANDDKFEEYINSVTAIPFSIRNYYPGGKISGHQMSFYICGGKQFFYEDNLGILPFNWKLFFRKFYELVKEKAEQVKIKSEHGKLYKEKIEAESDPQKKAHFEALKGKLFEEVEKKWSLQTPEKEILSVSLNCLKYKKGVAFSTPYYPCIITNKNEQFSFLTVYNDKIEEGSVAEPKVIEEDEGNVEFIFPSPKTVVRIFDTFFLIYTLGTDKDSIKNTGFEFDSSSRLERKSLLMGIIDKDERFAINQIESAGYFSNDDLVDALYLAIHLNNTKVIEKLIDKDVKVFSLTLEGFSPISLAIEENKPEIMKLLLKKETIANQAQYKEFTMPYFVLAGDVAHKSTKLTEVLLQNGFDINSEFPINYWPYKYTLLYLAYVFRDLELIKFLCSKGADSSILPKQIKTNTIKTLKDLARADKVSEEIITALDTCSVPTSGGRFKQTRKRKIEKQRRGSRNNRAQ